jgi:hypothetical protein
MEQQEDSGRRLKELLHHFGLSNRCRIHNTCRHNELDCVTFLGRIEMALQGKKLFWDVHQPLDLANLEEELIDIAAKAF